MVSSQVSLPGYQISDILYEGYRTVVYRGYRDNDSLPVVIKLLKSPYPRVSKLVNFRNQYTITKNIHFSGIIQTYSLVTYQHRYLLIMEDFGGISLSDWRRKRQNQGNLRKFLEIAISLCDTLNFLYHQKIIHKDIKSSNILINPETKQVKLIDFSIASLLPRETQTLVNPEVLEGTLAYISPEQTGRMNRGIDHRTDLYSLGVTFYELLTGKLPFHSQDAMELIHCHIAKAAPLVNAINPEIPNVIAEIVNKLMAKNAEDRYQSALGLKYDLEKCWMQLQETGRIEGFSIAQRDVCDRFLIPDKLYGRETEVKTLLTAFERVSQGATEITLIAGLSGVGKTAVVNEVHKPILRQRGYFIQGKYDQLNRNIPLSAFVRAFRDLMRQLFTESNAITQQWKQKILAALGNNGQVIIEVIPELESIIGKQPPAIELSGTAAENRFNLLFQKFTQVFTSAEHPLVIFLDDLQWADSASLKLIQLLITNTGYLLLIGAYRDHEVNTGHPLMLTLSELQKKSATINMMTLAPLNQIQINQLVADTIKCSELLASPLSKLVFQKTQGNPFFATQFLKALHQDGFIQFDFELGCWQCDITQVTTQAVTDDVVTFMSYQLQKLSDSTQYLLQLAACIGNTFNSDTLAIVAQSSPNEVFTDLWQALQAGLILPINEVYKFYLGEENLVCTLDDCHSVTYKFLHDRVQQAAYSLITDDRKQATHLQIGQLLLHNSTASQREERLFEIVNHVNIASTLIVQPSERESLAQLNLAAGRKAKTATAYGMAINHFATGIKLLLPTAWQSHYTLTLVLHEEITEACYLHTDFEQMERWANIVLQNSNALLDTIKVQQTRIMGAKTQGKFLESIQIGLQVLRSLGIEFPAQPTQEEIEQAFHMTRSLWADQHPFSLLNLPPMSDPQLLAAMEILTVLVSAAYISGSSLMPLLIVKQIELSIQSGNSPVSVFAYGDYGVILCGLMGDIENGYEFGELAFKLREQLQLISFKPRNWYAVHAFIKHWKTPIAEILLGLQATYRSALETGDIEVACVSAVTSFHYAFHRGQELTELNQLLHTYYPTIKNYKHATCLHEHNIYQQIVLNLLREGEGVPEQLTGAVFNPEIHIPQMRVTNQRTALWIWSFNQCFLYYLFGKYAAASQMSAQAAQHLDGAIATFSIPVYSFLDALIQLTQYATASFPEQQNILLKVQQYQQQLHYWATLAPSNHQHRWQLVEAERCRVLGNKTDAIDAYDRAISLAQANHFLQDEAIANELAAKFYLDWGREKVAAGYMQEAYYSYTQWGAKAKTDDLAKHYPNLLTPIFYLTKSGIGESLSTKSSISANKVSATLDLNTVLKAYQTLSSEIQLDRLLQKLIQLVITNAGADKAALFLNYEGTLQLGIKYFDHAFQSWERKPVDQCQKIPHTLIHYVERTLETVINNCKNHVSTMNDPYCLQYQPKSLLCTPILHQGQLLAILYLENAITSGVFTSERVELLKLLCSQAAISLVNARLYEQSQSYAQQLERSLQELRESESRFQTLAQNIPGIILRVAINLKDRSVFMPYVSSGCYDLYGVSAEAVMAGQYSLRDFEHPDDQPRIQQAIEQSIENLSLIREEFRIISYTGEIKWIQAAAQPQIYPDDLMIWDSVVIDITEQRAALHERKQAEIALAESETKFRGLVEGVTDVIWSAETDGTLSYLSPQFQTMFGLNPADYVGKVFLDLIHPDDLEGMLGSMRRIVEQGEKILNQEFRHLCQDGRYLWVTVNAAPIYDAEGHIIRHQGIIRDISDRKKHEEQLEKTNAELIRATRLKDEFLATMSHELRTPLNAILGMTEGLQDEIFGEVNEKQLKALNTIEHSGNHLLELINEVLDLSKIASGQIQLNRANTAIIPLCQQSLEFIKPQAAKKSIQIESKLPIDLPKFYIDERRICQVLINLLNNAVKFTPESGSITLEVIFPSATKGQNYLQIAITDTGIGIAPEHFQKVFEPFIQIDSKLNRNYEGTGLGLALVKRIVELHGGEVTLTSELGVGSCFAIYLPMYVSGV
ncbi:AAA family ATPase [Nostoc sp. CMAA1605]|uniref:AAA family ATPase n=1 Tax=Nostoc sp. CMAA1605 TaxID=2055159 RepID=UPI001F38C0D3|nr:AAA family ATPase [Nostoc sp. CMAA1605]